MQVCRQLHPLNVSVRAVRRARRKCPAAIFWVGDPTQLPAAFDPPGRFDLVVACYVGNVSLTLQRTADLGRACLVTYYSAHHERLDRELASIKGVGRITIQCEDRSWSVV
jgi:hypothetical protein